MGKFACLYDTAAAGSCLYPKILCRRSLIAEASSAEDFVQDIVEDVQREIGTQVWQHDSEEKQNDDCRIADLLTEPQQPTGEVVEKARRNLDAEVLAAYACRLAQASIDTYRTAFKFAKVRLRIT